MLLAAYLQKFSPSLWSLIKSLFQSAVHMFDFIGSIVVKHRATSVSMGSSFFPLPSAAQLMVDDKLCGIFIYANSRFFGFCWYWILAKFQILIIPPLFREKEREFLYRLTLFSLSRFRINGFQTVTFSVPPTSSLGDRAWSLMTLLYLSFAGLLL